MVAPELPNETMKHVTDWLRIQHPLSDWFVRSQQYFAKHGDYQATLFHNFKEVMLWLMTVNFETYPAARNIDEPNKNASASLTSEN